MCNRCFLKKKNNKLKSNTTRFGRESTWTKRTNVRSWRRSINQNIARHRHGRLKNNRRGVHDFPSPPPRSLVRTGVNREVSFDGKGGGLVGGEKSAVATANLLSVIRTRRDMMARGVEGKSVKQTHTHTHTRRFG